MDCKDILPAQACDSLSVLQKGRLPASVKGFSVRYMQTQIVQVKQNEVTDQESAEKNK